MTVMNDAPEGQESTPTAFDFRNHIPEPLRGEKVWESVKDNDAFFKNYVDMSKYTVGAIKIPGKDATPEEVSAYHKKLGRPDSVDGYQLADHGVQWNDESMKGFQEAAFKAGISNDAYNAFAGEYARQVIAAGQARSQAAAEATESLQSEWGAAYDRKIGTAQRALQNIFGEELAGQIGNSDFGNNKEFITKLVSLGEQLQEKGVMSAPTDGVRTAQQALDKANELMTSPEFLNAKDPRHEAVVRQVQKLFEEAYN